MSILRARAARLQRPLGLVLYNGPSSLDGELIVVIATGFRRKYRKPENGRHDPDMDPTERCGPVQRHP